MFTLNISCKTWLRMTDAIQRWTKNISYNVHVVSLCLCFNLLANYATMMTLFLVKTMHLKQWLLTKFCLYFKCLGWGHQKKDITQIIEGGKLLGPEKTT